MLLSLLLLGLMATTTAQDVVCMEEYGERWVAFSGCDPTCDNPEPEDCNTEDCPSGCACIPGYVRVSDNLCVRRSVVCAPCQGRKCACTFGSQCAYDEETCPPEGCDSNPCPPGCICCCKKYAICPPQRTCTIGILPCWKMSSKICHPLECGGVPPGSYCCCTLNEGSCPFPRKCKCFKKGCDCKGMKPCPPEKCPKYPCPQKRPNCCCRAEPDVNKCNGCDDCECLDKPCDQHNRRTCKKHRCPSCSDTKYCCCKPKPPPCTTSGNMLCPCYVYGHDYGTCDADKGPAENCCCVDRTAQYCGKEACCKCMRRRYCPAFRRKYCNPRMCGRFCAPFRCCCRGNKGLMDEP